MASTARRHLIALTLWLLAGSAGAFAAWRVAQRPANLHADALTLRPKAGDWGPVHLSVVKLGPVPNADGHTALVFVNAGSRGSGLIVGLPNLTFAPASARTVQLSSEPLSAGDLANELRR